MTNKEKELEYLHREIQKLKGDTQTSGFGPQSDTQSVKKQLAQIQEELEREANQNMETIKKSLVEAEQVETQLEKARETELEMRTRMQKLQDELE